MFFVKFHVQNKRFIPNWTGNFVFIDISISS